MRYSEEMKDEMIEKLSEMHEELVPSFGPADTLAGEIVRSTEQLIYRFYNDDDRLFIDYGNETCNPAYRYLMAKICHDSTNMKDALLTLEASNAMSDEGYEDALMYLAESVIDYIEKDPELKSAKNSDNYWDYDDPDDYNWKNIDNEDF